jgi:hypothetical protein
LLIFPFVKHHFFPIKTPSFISNDDISHI